MGRRILRWIVVIFIILSVLITYLIFSVKKPPHKEIANARINLTKAEKANSMEYAGLMFKMAKSNYDSAMNEWQKENKKVFFLRDYKKVKEFAIESNKLALNSIGKAKNASKNIRNTLEGQISQLKKKIELFYKFYNYVPLTKNQRNELANGKILFEECMLAFKKQDYKLALQKVDSAEIIIGKVSQYSEDILQEYFKNYPEWEKWAERSIKSSRVHKRTCLIIDKYSRKCFVYKNGVIQNTYNIELSSNWIGDKNYQGDKSTPEGFYKIVSKKAKGETRYYKALLLNYPNEDDKKRFLKNKKNGQVHKNATIGNLIEIHGHGGKGTDWTDGCVALKDDDMDKLFSDCIVGTEVTILGSLKPFQEIINSKNGDE